MIWIHATALLWVIFAGSSVTADGQQHDNSTIVFDPTDALMTPLDSVREIAFRFDDHVNLSSAIVFTVTSKHPHVAEVLGNSSMTIQDRFEMQMNYSFSILGVQSGFADLYWEVREQGQPEKPSGVTLWTGTYKVSVVRLMSIFDIVFSIAMTILVAINNINIGCQLQLDVVVRQLKKPVAPCIGLSCQFLFMPLASYAYSRFLLDSPEVKLGLFTVGCSPGGTYSNFWTLLFKGDVDLSVTMTFVSTIAALGMMPFWMFTLGRSFVRENAPSIPFSNIVISLVSLTIPLGIGLLIQYKKPHWVKISQKVVKPFSFFILLVAMVVGISVNWRILTMFTWSIVLAAGLVVGSGYIFGGIAAFIAKRSRAQIIAVAIETGIQNMGIAFVLVMLTLTQPSTDLAMVPIVAQALLTSLPLLLVYGIMKFYARFLKRGGADQEMKTLPGDTNGDLKKEKKLSIDEKDLEKLQIVKFDFDAPETVV